MGVVTRGKALAGWLSTLDPLELPPPSIGGLHILANCAKKTKKLICNELPNELNSVPYGQKEL